MDIQKEREAFEASFKLTEIFKRESRIRNKNILEFAETAGIYFNIIVNDAWSMWQAAKTQVPEQILENDCMIGQTWFIKGTSASALIQHAEEVYKSEAIAQNSKIEFGTDDNEHWWAHEVPFYGEVQMDRIEEHGFVEWDIHFNDCWQGPFNSKSECIKHLEECIAEERAEAQEQAQ